MLNLTFMQKSDVRFENSGAATNKLFYLLLQATRRNRNNL